MLQVLLQIHCAYSALSSLCVSESLIASEEAFEMSLVFFNKLCNIILILDLLSSLIKSKLLEGHDLGVTQRDALGCEELTKDINGNFA